MACDPKTLVAQAACLECQIPDGMWLPVMIVLAAQIAGVALTPAGIQTLVSNAACLECQVPDGMRWPVVIALACQIAGV